MDAEIACKTVHHNLSSTDAYSLKTASLQRLFILKGSYTCVLIQQCTVSPAPCSTVYAELAECPGCCSCSSVVSTAKLVSDFLCLCVHVSVRLCVLYSLLPLVRVPGPHACKSGVPHLTSTLQKVESRECQVSICQ